MGEVYLAEDTRLERQVALKILLEDVAEDSDRVRRFVQEAKAASALNHPNILTVYEIGEYGRSRYIATEFIQGDTLRERMRSEPIGLNEAIAIARQTAASLAAAHEAGILHRDVKPENIMIRKDGLVKILDFGLAKLTETAAREPTSEDQTRIQLDTQPGVLVGTVAYMSPEQIRGRKVDARSDIFSLGIVMYELLRASSRSRARAIWSWRARYSKDEPTPARQLSPWMPRQLERIIEKALRKDRDHRYQHVKDLQIDLEDLLDELKFESKTTKKRRLYLAHADHTTAHAERDHLNDAAGSRCSTLSCLRQSPRFWSARHGISARALARQLAFRVRIRRARSLRGAALLASCIRPPSSRRMER